MSLPSPDEADDISEEEWEDITAGMPPLGPEREPPRVSRETPATPVEVIPEEPGDDLRDEPPAHAARDWAKPAAGGRSKRARVTVATKREVASKLALMLMPPAQLWSLVDPTCGGAALEVIPNAAPAYAELICQSPRAVEFFLGTGGTFLLWWNAIVMTWPLLSAVLTHHVMAETAPAPAVDATLPPQPQPDLSQYVA
jgi:hypothetical protein